MNQLRFWLNDRLVEEASVVPTTTLLNYVREHGLTGTKEGCAEGDCGACTVAVVDTSGREPTFRAVNSCLVMLPMLQGKRVYTVEALKQKKDLHPAQQAMVDKLGSQCGYCTPGIVMSLFEATYRADLTEPWQIDDQMCGNLCRCTGYRPIRDAAKEVAGKAPDDRFRNVLREAKPQPMALSYAAAGHRFFTPATLDELWRRIHENPDAKFIAGGTDLSLLVTKRFQELPALISLESIPELRVLERTEQGFTLGAGVSLSDLHEFVRRDSAPLDKMLRFFASRQIKNRATLGGNLCNASPIGDMAPVLIGLGATVKLVSKAGTRELPLETFFLGYRKTDLKPGEILASVFVPHLPKDARATSFKVSKRRELDISAVAAGCYVLVENGLVKEARLAFGGMAATPARAKHTEAALVGRRWTLETVKEVAPILEKDFQPLSDHRGTSWYRMTVAKNLLRAFYLETIQVPTPRLSPRPSSTVHVEVSR